ncbi:apolipophorins-like [Ctenocephalides felis]|uniref:apolipophorins-like n=1 Tax=Ctenocephalides felis TaxID=7515 RepID=UPI000E6E55C6|nr:apolipophorins-like [Ctenocephalides felis]
MHRGAVEALCPTEGDAESPWIVNFKRGVLSALQTGKGDMRQSHVAHERDVSGDCFTRFHITEIHGGLLIVRRFKDLTQCSSRKKTIFSLPSINYASPNSKPVISSHHNCTQTLDNQRVVSSSCQEKHKLRPFSNGQAGAVTTVQQTLVLRKELKLKQIPDIHAPIETRTTMLYEETISKLPKVSNEEIFNILEEMKEATSTGVEDRATTLFSNLVTALKTLNKADMISVIGKSQNPERHMILDAMQLIQTDESVATMMELLRNEVLSEGQFNSWLTFLSFSSNPTLYSLKMLTPLLDHSNKNAILSISSMIYRYCQMNTKCMNENVIITALESIEKYLGDSCRASTFQSQNDIILALKGLGNAGHAVSTKTLTNCYKTSTLPVEIRVQALAAYRRFSCKWQETKIFLDTLANKTEPTEVRISSYLAAMNCLSNKDLYKIRGVLLAEKANQVGSFIWTHLTNIQESSARWKTDIKYILSSESLRKKFDTNFRKYSRNYEFSSFSKLLNAGGALESNVIFSPESYIPRSAMVNLTLDIFGETMNVLEIGGRAEGLEDTFEKLFSPDGYYPDETLSKIFNVIKADGNTNEIEAFIPKSEYKKIRVPKGAIYAKIFGNELNYFNFNNLQDMSNTEDLFQDMIYKLFRGRDIDFVKSFSVLDASYSIPTIIGFPLRLSLNATGTVGLKIGGKVDVENFRDFKMNVVGHIVPSAAIRIVGTMVMDASVTKSGLKMDVSMNSNSYIDGSIRLDEGKLVDIKLKVPKEKMNLVKITSEIYLISPSGNEPIKGHSQRETFYSCGSETAAVITGMQLCNDISYPNASSSLIAPYFPLTGSARYILDLKKVDNFDSYEFKYHKESKIISSEPVHMFNLYINTPNSNVKRNIDIGYKIFPKAMNASAKIHTPFKRYNFVGKLTNTVAYKALESEISEDDKRILGVKGSFTKDKVSFLGDLNRDKDKWSWNGNLASSELSGDMKGSLSYTSSIYCVNNSMTYIFKNQQLHSVSLYLKYENILTGMLKKLGISFSLQSTEFPQSHIEFSWGFQKTRGYIEHNAVAGLGDVIWKTHQLYRLKILDGYYDFEAKCAFNCLSKDIDYLVSAKYLTNFKGIIAHSIARLNDEHRAYAKVNILKDPLTNDLGVFLQFLIPKRKWTLDGHLTHKGNEYGVLFTGSAIRSFAVEEEINFKAVGSYTDLSDISKLEHSITLHITQSGGNIERIEPWTLKGKLLVSNKHFECSASADYKKINMLLDNKVKIMGYWNENQWISFVTSHEEKQDNS